MQMAPQHAPEKAWVLLIFLRGSQSIGYEMRDERQGNEQIEYLRCAVNNSYKLVSCQTVKGHFWVKPEEIQGFELQERIRQTPPPDPFQMMQKIMTTEQPGLRGTPVPDDGDEEAGPN